MHTDFYMFTLHVYATALIITKLLYEPVTLSIIHCEKNNNVGFSASLRDFLKSVIFVSLSIYFIKRTTFYISKCAFYGMKLYSQCSLLPFDGFDQAILSSLEA